MILAAGLTATLVVGLAGGCGGPRGSLDQLSVTQYRYNVDEGDGVVRVVGVVRNTGEERTPPADVVVTLVGRTGAQKGQNRTELPALAGGAQRRFALSVTPHGRVDDVRIAIVARGGLVGDENADGDAAAGPSTNTAAQEDE